MPRQNLLEYTGAVTTDINTDVIDRDSWYNSWMLVPVVGNLVCLDHFTNLSLGPLLVNMTAHCKLQVLLQMTGIMCQFEVVTVNLQLKV